MQAGKIGPLLFRVSSIILAITLLSSMSHSELTDIHSHILADPGFESRTGAGMGLTSLATGVYGIDGSDCAKDSGSREAPGCVNRTFIASGQGDFQARIEWMVQALQSVGSRGGKMLGIKEVWGQEIQKNKSTGTDLQGDDIFDLFARLKKSLAEVPNLPRSVLDEMGLLEASLKKVRSLLKQAQEDSAYAWAKIAAEQGFFVFRELKKLPMIDELIGIGEKGDRTGMVEKYRERQAEIVGNIDQTLKLYADSFQQLARFNTETAQGGFEKYLKYLIERNAADQVWVLKTVREHFVAYVIDQKPDPVKWRNDFMNVGK